MEGSRLIEKALKIAKKKRIKQAELATMVGISPARFSEGKKGTWQPSVDVAKRLADKLGVPLDYLADDSLDEPPVKQELSDDDWYVLRTFRTLKLDADEAVLRLHGDVTMTQDRPGLARNSIRS